jgi:hypothetical protein
MDIREINMSREAHLEGTLKRTVRLCQAITRNMDDIACIKTALKAEDLTFARQLLNELDTEDQKLLMIAPTKGGCFTTEERKTLRGLWDITSEDW